MQYQKDNYNQSSFPTNNEQQSQSYEQNPPYEQTPSHPQSSFPQNISYNDIPEFNMVGRGTGIDENELYIITHAAYDAFSKREDPLSDGIVKRIKKQLKGEWMVFACFVQLKGFDFTLSIVTGNDFLCFTIKDFMFQVCRLRD